MIKSLRLKNFRRYEDCTFDFGPGITFVEGQNNAGKTTLFYAIEYALFGPFPPFRSARELMRPGARGMGVEIVFTGRDGHDYRLQRIHVLPPRSRTKVEGHFTLKQRRLGEQTERYVLSSDFQDHSEALALKLSELLGLSKRAFEIAVHVRQGEITSMLQGDPRLDIVLGVTAAVVADDELRAMALEYEKDAATLPVLEAELARVEAERARREAEVGALRERAATAAAEREALEQAAQRLARSSGMRAPLVEKAAALAKAAELSREGRRRREEHDGRLAERRARLGAPAQVAARGAEIEAELAAIEIEAKALGADIAAAREERRTLDQARGDLKGRLARRAGLPTGEGARCEACGQLVDVEKSAAEVAGWTRELAELDARIADRAAAIEAADGRREAAEKRRRALSGEIVSARRSAEELAELAAAQEEATRREAEATLRLVRAAGEAHAGYLAAREATGADGDPSLTFRLEPPAEPPADVPAAEAWLVALRAEVARVEDAHKEAGIEARVALEGKRGIEQRAAAELAALEGRAAEMERERARLGAEIAERAKKRALATRLRTLSQAFKELQMSLRDRAAAELGRDTLSLHRKLGADAGEISALSIDPGRYSVNVTPADVGEEVPAYAYQGGGHKLLLGLAFKLALARMVGPCPFILLDEPTYGLDAERRRSLLNRVAELGIAPQMLLITHQEIGEVPGSRIEILRNGQTSTKRDLPEEGSVARKEEVTSQGSDL